MVLPVFGALIERVSAFLSSRRELCTSAAGCLAITVLAEVGHPVVVLGSSMEPTLRTGSVVWVDRQYYQAHTPLPGDVVLLRHAGQTFVKRVYRRAGDTVYYVGSGAEPILLARASLAGWLRSLGGSRLVRLKRVPVPEGCVFVVGDNLERSMDSRTFGMVPMSEVIGRVSVEPDATKMLVGEFSPPLRAGDG